MFVKSFLAALALNVVHSIYIGYLEQDLAAPFSSTHAHIKRGGAPVRLYLYSALFFKLGKANRNTVWVYHKYFNDV